MSSIYRPDRIDFYRYTFRVWIGGAFAYFDNEFLPDLFSDKELVYKDDEFKWEIPDGK